jgi:hypothetical protein
MTNANFSPIHSTANAPKALNNLPQPKTIQSHTKANAADPSLSNWYVQANDYYNKVMSGQEPMPEGPYWQEFLDQYAWAGQQLGFGAGGGNDWGAPVEGGSSFSTGGESVSDPFGGMPGTSGQWIHREESARIGFLGGQNREIWANDITIDVAPLSAKVEVVKVTDNTVQPATEVLKVVVTDAATGTEDVYVINDWEDAEIKINAADPDAITIPDDMADAITIDKFESASEQSDVSAQASIPGEAHETEDNWYIYEGRMGETIEFYPEGSGEADEEEIHEVWGDSRILTRPSDEVRVKEGNPEDADGYTVEVTHRDGSIDTYYIHKGFDVEVNAMEEYLTWETADGDVSGEEAIPEAFAEVFSLNGAGGSGSSDAYNPDHPEDTQPAELEADGKLWGGTVVVYDNPTVDIHPHAEEDSDVNYHAEIFASNLNMTFDSMRDEINIYRSNEDYYQISVTFADGKTRSYFVDKDTIQNVTINGGQVELVGDGWEEDEVFQIPEVLELKEEGGIGEEPEELSPSEQANMDIAIELAGINGINMTAQEIYDASKRECLNLAGFNDPMDPALFDFLIEIDPKLEDLLQDYRNYDGETDGHVKGTRLRNHLVELWSAVFPDDDFEADTASGGKHTDDVYYNGQRYDIFDQDNRHDSPYGWIRFGSP